MRKFFASLSGHIQVAVRVAGTRILLIMSLRVHRGPSSPILLKSTGDHSALKNLTLVPYLSSHSLVSIFLCLALEMQGVERVYLVSILYWGFG